MKGKYMNLISNLIHANEQFVEMLVGQRAVDICGKCFISMRKIPFQPFIYLLAINLKLQYYA